MARYPSCSTHQYKPDELLSIQQEQRYRGRLRAQNIEHPVEHQDKQNSSSEYGFEAEWFSGDPDIEERAGNVKEDSGHNTMDMSADRAPMNIQATGHDRKAPVERLCAFPPYLAVKRMLVKGSTCRAIMQLHDRGLRASTIAREIKATAFIEKYTPEEVRAIIHCCSDLGLAGQTPLATESWENESIEGWWFEEESYCEALRRQEPVDEDICGYDCNDGWWKDRQDEENRDWDRFGYPSIGAGRHRGSS
ncbi:hypothetical protein ABEF95_005771 [Exophiala dermatitidis]